MYHLRKTLGVQSNNLHSFYVSSDEYRNYKLVLGIDFEQVLEMGFTVYSSRTGDILNVRLTNASHSVEANHAHNMQILLYSNQQLEIRDSGVTVFD